jgi:hypothetical protein
MSLDAQLISDCGCRSAREERLSTAAAWFPDKLGERHVIDCSI